MGWRSILGERAGYFKKRSGKGWYAEGRSGKISNLRSAGQMFAGIGCLNGERISDEKRDQEETVRQEETAQAELRAMLLVR